MLARVADRALRTGQAHLQTLAHVGSKLKSLVFVASEMSGFKVVPSPIGWG
jgi:hypothetical protein